MHGSMQATIYDTVSFNNTDYNSFDIRLQNGVIVPRLEKTGGRLGTITENIYYLRLLSALYIVSHLASKNFWPVKHKIKVKWPQTVRSISLKINIFYDLLCLIGLPGPRIVGFRESCSPQKGLLRDGTGNIVLKSISMLPARKLHVTQRNLKYFLFNPLDGSILQLVPSLSKMSNRETYYQSVDIYMFKSF
jgi:hypothetical protein